MSNRTGEEIERLIDLLAKLPGLGPRSGRRAALNLIKKRDLLLVPLARALTEVAEKVTECSVCGAIDTRDPCAICCNPERDATALCVVEEAGDLWALERAGAFKGRYHVLGGVLSALDGVGPDDLRIPELADRARDPAITEVVLALNATVDGQTTAYYIADALEGCGVEISGLAQGVPIGGELDYLDDGTISAAFRQRKRL
jgi:recombination protein RecR